MAKLLLLVVLLAWPASLAAAPPTQAPRCRFFTETGGGRGGFSVCDDAAARFLASFEAWGLQNVGYPVSRRYVRDGFVHQAFQKAIMQARPDQAGATVLVNIFDDLHRDGFDERLLATRQTPRQLPAGWDGGIPFEQVVPARQALLNARPALRAAYFAIGDPLTFFGLPTSEVQDMGNHYAIRLQRAVLQEWKEAVPWARAGQVTIANGGDIAKELGGLPAEAIVPEPSPAPGRPTPPPATAIPPDQGSRPMTLVGAGDIASCGSQGDEATAALLDGIPGTIFTTGDNVYSVGSDRKFADCYDPSWGRHKARTRPSPGNHDYGTSGAAGYFNYFGDAAGPRDRGYYSYDLGAWHVVALNSNCTEVGGCGANSPQAQWLRADLAAHPAGCTLAYWHHARFSSGLHGGAAFMQPIWQILYDNGADVVLTGHDHIYERFAPQDATGSADDARGIRQFVVGTGGSSHTPVALIQPNSEVRNVGAYGVLKLTLRPDAYDWEFVPVAGRSFTDGGSARCH